MQTKIVGVDCDEGTPVPIPNTVVKLIYADNTWLVTAREDRTMPTQTERQIQKDLSFFMFMRDSGRSLFILFPHPSG